MGDVKDFEKEVIARSKTVPVLVDFWAPWCGPCRMLGPALEKLAQKHAGKCELAKVNTDVHQEAAARFGISAIPSVKLFVGGRPVAEFTGVQPEAVIERWLRESLPGKYDSVIQEAADLFRKGSLDEARATIETVLSAEGENRDARLTAAMIYVFTEPEKAKKFVESMQTGEPGYEIAESVRDLADIIAAFDVSGKKSAGGAASHLLNAVNALPRHDFDSALTEAIKVITIDRKNTGEPAKKVCIALFRFLGEEHEVSKKHRRAFGAVLNQ